MRAVEGLLTDQPQPVRLLACQVFGVADHTGLTRAQLESVRRACKRLAALGKAEVRTRSGRGVRPGGYRGSNPRLLTARTPRSDPEREEGRRLLAAAAREAGFG